MKLTYLTKAEVTAINKSLVKASGDPHAIIHHANLESNLETMEVKYNNKNGRESIIWKAAFWLHRMAKSGHAFAEGNKRTAFVTTLTFLGRNSCYLKRKNKKEQLEIAELIKSIARDEKTITQIAKWLDQRTFEVSEESVNSELRDLNKKIRKTERNMKQRNKYQPKNKRYKKVDAKYREDAWTMAIKFIAVLNSMKRLKNNDKRK